jgi:alkanesulfonate monooxygenase SsuD/methylene tetrahydromethanopterin reductase-like flavin-dependent oxidoreductase (luciferase family)
VGAVRFALDVPNFGAFHDIRLIAEVAASAEAGGWDGFFIWDHMAPGPPTADATVALSAIALATERIRFGPLVTPLPRRRVQKVAREFVSLDRLSRGRVVLGVGLGFPPDVEYVAFGEDGSDRRRADRLDESLEVLDALWRGVPVEHDGEHLHVRTAPFLPRPLQEPRIPVWVAGGWPTARNTFRRAARWDGIYAMPSDPSERFYLLPDEIHALRDAIGRTDPGFEVLATAYAGAAPDVLEAAGATWWIQVCTTGDEALERARSGPPRSN